MQIREIMSTDVRLVDPGMTVRDCARRMRDEDLGAFPVGEDDRLVGMVTDRDICCRGVADSDSAGDLTVRDVMSEGILYVFDDADAQDAAGTIAEHKVRRLPVVNRDKRLVGMVAIADLAKAGIKGAEFTAYKDVAQPTGAERKM